MQDKEFKVLIVGAGIAGLGLAKMLEKAGIDYVLLEAYPEIAPQKGASIALHPNGLRILDQLGCYDDLIAAWDVSLLDAPERFRLPSGRILTESVGFKKHIEKRHGYPMIVTTRQSTQQALWDSIEHKERVFVRKRVSRVDIVADGVVVQTQDGDEFYGDILIGADGIHSKVRAEMHRIANEVSPGTFDTEEEAQVPSSYKCLFGICDDIPNSGIGTEFMIGRGYGMMIVKAPFNRIFILATEPMEGGPKRGKDIPKFTKDDEKQFIERYKDTAITKTVTFGDLCRTMQSSVLTPVHEYVYKNWHFERIITIGDASHNQTPYSGQGGNLALEEAAALVNSIAQRLKHSSMPPEQPFLSIDDIRAAFSEIESACKPRAAEQVDTGKMAQRIFAFENTLLSTIALSVIRLQGLDGSLNQATAPYPTGPRLQISGLHSPRRPHSVPFIDELPEKPLSSPFASRLVTALTLCLLAVLVFLSFWNYDKGAEGVPTIIRVPLVVSAALVWVVESYRVGNQLGPLSLAIFFAVACQIGGSLRVGQIYLFLSTIFGNNTVAGRSVFHDAAHVVLFAVGIATTLPFVSRFLPAQPPFAFLQQRPWDAIILYAVFLTWAMKTTLPLLRSDSNTSGPGAPEDKSFKRYSKRELLSLKTAYAVVFVALATTHVLSIVRVFSNTHNVVVDVLLSNVLYYIAGLFVHLLYLVWDLRRLGYVTTHQALQRLLYIILGQVFVGPGATYVAVWSWRESLLAKLGD